MVIATKREKAIASPTTARIAVHRGEPHRWRWQARLERFGMACARQWEGWALEIERIR